MINKKIIEEKIKNIEEFLHVIRKIFPPNKKSIKLNYMLQGAFERLTFLICRCSLDIVDIIYNHEKFKKTDNYIEKINKLEKKKIFNRNDKKLFITCVALYNVLMSSCDIVDNKVILDLLYNNKYSINNFIKILKN